MAATTPPRPDSGRLGAPIERFSRSERAAHWTGALLFAVVLLTAAALYVTPLSAVVGRRQLVKDLHVWTGLALPVPALLAMVGRRGAALRSDVRRLNRWTAGDRRWLRSLGRDVYADRGKFNAGQKLNAAFLTGAVLVMAATGGIMRWFDPFPLSWRTGATFVHDWLALAVALALAGHVVLALLDRDALRSMVTGRVSQAWAEQHAPGWLAEVTGREVSALGEGGRADGERLDAVGQLDAQGPLEDG